MSSHPASDPEFNDPIAKPSPRRRFRFVELLAALGIIAVLIALLLPAVRSSPHALRRSQCVNNLKQIGLALRDYEEANRALPPAYTVDAKGRPLHSWRTLILPFLEQGPLYESIDLSKPWDDPANVKALETPLPVYQCPESTGPRNSTTYLANVAQDGCLIPGEPRRLADLLAAHDQTLMVIEADEGNAVPWMAPIDAGEETVMGIDRTKMLHHAGGTNACLVDGSVRFLRADGSVRARRALISISGKDNVSADDW